MLRTSELQAFYKALKEHPGDQVTLLAMADWYEDHQHLKQAECIRWLAEEKKWPFRYEPDDTRLRHYHDSWHEGWYWWTTGRERRSWGCPKACVLPHRLWERLAHGFNYDPLVFKEYRSVKVAIEAVLAVWDKPPARRRKRT